MLLDTTNDPFLESSFRNPIVAIAFLIALLIASKYFDRRPVADFGLQLSSVWWRDFGLGFGIGGLIISLAFMLGYLMGWVEIKEVGYNEFSAPFLLAFTGQLLRYAAGSFFEELLSRSYLLRLVAETAKGKHLSSKRAILLAWAITATLFGALHLLNPNSTALGAVNITLLGLFFGLGMIYTGSLALPIGLHMAWNVFQNNVFGLANSGKATKVAFWLAEGKAAPLWTGAEFGLEGGLSGTLAVLIGVILVRFFLGRFYPPVVLELSLAEPPDSQGQIIKNNVQSAEGA